MHVVVLEGLSHPQEKKFIELQIEIRLRNIATHVISDPKSARSVLMMAVDVIQEFMNHVRCPYHIAGARRGYSYRARAILREP
jgi:hypothetical protein